jgi:hypothetical protein
LSGEIEFLLLGELSWGGLLHVLAELRHDIVLVNGVVRKLNVVLDNHVTVEAIIDAGVNIEVSVLWHEVGSHHLLLHWLWLLVRHLFGLLSLFLGLRLIESLRLLSHESIVGSGVVSQLHGQSVVELSLVDGIVVAVRHWLLRKSSPSLSFLFIIESFLELGLLVVEVLGVDVVIAGLNGHAVIELTLIDGVVVTGWGLLGRRSLNSLSLFFKIESLLELSLLVIEILGVEVLVSGLKGKTIIELILINGLGMRHWDLMGDISPGLSLLFKIESLLELSLLVIEVLGVEVLVSGLNSKAIIELCLVNGIVVSRWGLNSRKSLNSLSSLLSVEDLLGLGLLVVEVLGVDIVIAGLEGHTVVKLVLVNRSILLAVNWGILLSHDLLKLSLGSRDSSLPVLGVVTGLDGHTVVKLVLVEGSVRLAVNWGILLAHDIIELSLGSRNSSLPVLRVILELKVHTIVKLIHVNSLVSMLLLLSLSLLSSSEFLLGKSIGSSVNLVKLVLGSILFSDCLLELSSLVLNHIVPEF